MYNKEQLETIWNKAVENKIQQIKEEWEWLIDITVNKFLERGKILEIGCYDGGSSRCLSHFASSMVTIDNNNPCRFDVSKLDAERYTYIAGDSHDPKVLAQILDEDWDFVFIDGDHSYEGVKADFNNIYPHLKKGTPVAFHDIVMSKFHHTHGCYVGEFWRDLKEEYPQNRIAEFITNGEWAGIGVIWC